MIRSDVAQRVWPGKRARPFSATILAKFAPDLKRKCIMDLSKAIRLKLASLIALGRGSNDPSRRSSRCANAASRSAQMPRGPGPELHRRFEPSGGLRVHAGPAAACLNIMSAHQQGRRRSRLGKGWHVDLGRPLSGARERAWRALRQLVGASADVVAGVSAGANALVGEAACSFSRIALARRGVNGEIASARGGRRRPIAPTALQRVVAE